MKHFLILLIVPFFLTACKSNYSSVSTPHIKIIEFKIPNTSIRAIQVVNDSTLVYVGTNSKFGLTTNLGKTWKTIYLNLDTIYPDYRSIAINNNFIFALSAGSPALLYKINIKTLHKKLVYKNYNPNIFFDAMTFIDSKNGMAIGDALSKCLTLLQTKDGGDTWQLKNCNQFPKVLNGEAAFAASNTNIANIRNHVWIASGGINSRVYYSNDKGDNWEVYNTPMLGGKSSTGIFSVAFANKKHGIIIGGNYLDKKINKSNKAITKNGGKTWQLVSDGKEPTYKSCVQYIPKSNGGKLIAVGTTGINFSKDRGKTWIKLSNKGFYTIRFISKKRAWLAGANKIALMYLK